MTDQATVQALKALLEFDTPTVGNGLELMGVRDPSAGYTGPDVRALMPEMGVRVGIAVTARLDTTSPGTDAITMDIFWEMVRHIESLSGASGRVGSTGAGAAGSSSGSANAAGTNRVPVFAVVESVGLRPRYTVTIGDGMGTHLKNAGAVGFLTNGCIRDVTGVREVPLACWAAGVSPMHGRLRWLDWGSPVVVDGMTVRTGDIIHADENGTLCFGASHAAAVVEKAHAVRQKEARMFETLRLPGMTVDQYLASLKG